MHVCLSLYSHRPGFFYLAAVVHVYHGIHICMSGASLVARVAPGGAFFSGVLLGLGDWECSKRGSRAAHS